MKIVGIIVEVGRGIRRLDSNLSDPTALVNVGGSTSVLQWATAALQANGISEITYFGGYHIEKVLAGFPSIAVRYEPEWENGNWHTMLSALTAVQADAVLFLRSDVVVTNDAIRLLLDSGLSHASGHLSASASATPAAVLMPKAKLSGLGATKHGGLSLFRTLAENARVVDLSSSAAAISERVQLAKIVFKGKAQTLSQLRDVVQSLEVADQIRFSLDEWQRKPAECPPSAPIGQSERFA